MDRYQMRMADRELSLEEAYAILEAGEYCVISTVDEDGAPYGVPLSYVMLDGKLCIHTTNTHGHKMDDWHRDARVSVAVATEVEPCFEDTFFTTRFASVVASGRISPIQDTARIRKVLVALCMKYLPELKDEIGPAIEREIADTAAWEVTFSEVRAKGARRHQK
ncbi:pyridoxamine 5'-phosphate oxidase family protein [Adlercreutzia murintestinalis]|jgi:Predicted flavin-nucleotide-binding protein|uniref:pyridoxamine 5'-phosphate oxidase family protein n=1 Tax=Adlercreutzia murintestinalis TaxID=2941325 RepID=UPI00203E7BBD|nr:pyridoxamine 5'-phosphate oxidase family protein [Adlercreutzia murintestinalis]